MQVIDMPRPAARRRLAHVMRTLCHRVNSLLPLLAGKTRPPLPRREEGAVQIEQSASENLLVEITAQLLPQMRVTELAQRHSLDLADALTRNAEFDADLFQSAVPAIFQAVAQLNDLALSL